ncbi:MAG: 8-oxo-dGTP diphosphatase [Verrucomicrobia bacterium]|nr:8-oxo-dGTP diphosphatase [Verrucomicrobiota bacterium]
MSNPPDNPTAVADILWDDWQPQQRATLLFIIQGENILLIHKKRGLGAGSINGPGGRLEPGETERQAAIRETEEEIGVTPLDVSACGHLYFQFLSGLSIQCAVFRAPSYTGTLTETDEAKPVWFPIRDIPYGDMWEDDAYWLPHAIQGTPFKGYFIFDDRRMVDHRIDTGVVIDS